MIALVMNIVNDDCAGRYDSHYLQLPRGGLSMVTSTIYNFGGPSWTSLKGPLVEKRSAGSTDSSNGGLGAVFILSTNLN
jgi:hypothetical protein